MVWEVRLSRGGEEEQQQAFPFYTDFARVRRKVGEGDGQYILKQTLKHRAGLIPSDTTD